MTKEVKVGVKEVKVGVKEVKVGAKEVKVKEFDFYFTILNLINQNHNPTHISKTLNRSKQAVNHYIKVLKGWGIIEKRGYGVWEVKKDKYTDFITQYGKNIRRSKSATSGSLSTFTSFKSNIHALEVLIPIIKGGLDLVRDFEGYVHKGLKGWIPEYKRFFSPLGFTIRNNNNRSVSVFLWSRELPRSFDITGLVTGLVVCVYDLLKKKGVVLNIFESKVKNLHLSVSNDDLDRVFNKGEHFEVLLGRSCDKVLPFDGVRGAKAWVDSSPYLGVETNDVGYRNNLVMMPERVLALCGSVKCLDDNLKPVLSELSVQIKSHLGVLGDIRDGIKSFNNSVKKFDSRLSQSSLWRWL